MELIAAYFINNLQIIKKITRKEVILKFLNFDANGHQPVLRLDGSIGINYQKVFKHISRVLSEFLHRKKY